MNKNETLILGVALGAGLMYLLDPDRGRRRRALVRDQVAHGRHELEDLAEAASSKGRDLRNRARGMAAETRSRFRAQDVDDSILEARVRSEMGRLVSNPGSIHVAVDHGRVTLTGQVPTDEVERLVAQVRGVRGVRGVEGVDNQLDARQDAGDVPGLQGSRG